MKLVSPDRDRRPRGGLLPLPPGDLQARQRVLIENQWQLLEMLYAHGRPLQAAREVLDALTAITFALDLK